MAPILDIRNLSVEIAMNGRYYKALDSVSFILNKSEMVGLVGESGCGKSLTALSVIGLLPEAARVASGKILYRGADLLTLSEKGQCLVRGKEISMVFQEPSTALNPLIPVGVQIAESLLTHQRISRLAAKEAAVEGMRSVGLSRPDALYWEYPHQLSGGMKQRVVIAMALINKPALLLADEPTTALDATIQHQILQLIARLNQSLNTSVLLVSHDLGIVHELCSRVLVMYAGFVVEEGPTAEVLRHPLHPYTQKLLDAIPSADKRGKELYSIPGIVMPLQKRINGACPFAQRCSYTKPICNEGVPELKTLHTRRVRCVLAGGEAHA